MSKAPLPPYVDHAAYAEGRAVLADIKLGWLLRFRSVARHQSIARAARECCVDATCVSDSIQNLADALRRPLVYATTGVTSVIGERVRATVERLLDQPCLKADRLRHVSVAQLKCLIAVSEHASYVAAGKAAGYSRFQVMRAVKEIECGLGEALIVDKAPLKLSVFGEAFVAAAMDVVCSLERLEGPITYFTVPPGRKRRLPFFFKIYDGRKRLRSVRLERLQSVQR